MYSRAFATLACLLLSLAAVVIAPSVAAEVFTEGFESFTAGDTDPETDDFTFLAAGASTFVSSAQAHTGTKSLKYEGTAATNHASMTTNTDICGGAAQFWIYMAAYPDAGDLVQARWINVADGTTINSNVITLSIDSAGTLSFLIGSSSSTASDTPPGTFPLTTWVDFAFEIDCVNAAGSVFSSVMDTGLSADATGTYTQALDVFTIRETGPDGGHTFYVDDVLWDNGGAPATIPVASNQFAVTGLVGYSMDGSGRSIVTREDSGITVNSYSAADIASGTTGTFATPDCNTIDGVFAGFADDDVFLSFWDCDTGGDRDQLWIKGANLDTPVFNDCADLGEEEISENDLVALESFELPDDMQQMGSLSGAFIDWSDCETEFIDTAMVSWTFTTTAGRLGVYVVQSHDSGPGVDQRDDRVSFLLDPGANPLTGFCSWTSTGLGVVNGRTDWFGAVTQTGPTGLFSGFTSFGGGFGTQEPTASMFQEYLNTGSNANAVGIDCAQDSILLAFSDKIREIGNVSTTPVLVKETATTGTTNRGVAYSGNGEFIAWNDGTAILIGHAGNHTVTTSVPVPAGSFQGMEFDYTGGRLAIFTSTLITVVESAAATCELTGTCDVLFDDRNQQIGETETPGASDSQGLAGLDSRTSLFASMATIGAFALLGLAPVIGRRGRDRDGEE